jgi:hypothetical protein
MVVALAVRKVRDGNQRRSDSISSPSACLRIALVIAALLIAALASIYMIQMPGSFASTLASMFAF